MKSFLTMLLFLLVVTSTSVGEDKGEKEAIKTANHWLSLTDAGNYATSWDETAPAFKAAVPKEQWTQMLNANRAPLGRVISRSIKSAVYSTSLPGAPDGHYVVIQYETSFEHKKSAIETVTPSLGENGRQWRVSGYFIR
jgi:hypothetical protein